MTSARFKMTEERLPHPGRSRRRLTFPEWSKDRTLATLCCTVE